MPIPSSPPVGAIAYGESGIGYPISQLEGTSVVLRTSTGLLRVPLTSIHHWELPKPLEPRQPIDVGDKVQLKGTQRTYQVTRVYSVYRCQNTYEHWAELEGSNGSAHWLIGQLLVL